MRNIYISLLLLLLMSSAYANQTTVSNASEINDGSWVPGDTIVMINGTWTDQSISLKASGTDEQPIVLMAETPGEVILTGNSKLGFSGEHLHITSLFFKDGNAGSNHIISFRTSSSNLANNCRISNIAIENYNPSSAGTDSKWVSIYGLNNKVDHCSFVNKNNSGTLLVVWMESGVTPNHIIDHNYFGYRIPNLDEDGDELNGQEIIRIGDSKRSMTDANVQVTNNFFEYCNGEIEVISNKSGENLFSNNVFFECVGMLTLRHGNGCTVEGNYFFGNGISNTGGVRIIGEDHKVYNNYFEKLNGNGYRAALCMVRGVPDSELNEYFQVKNADVAFNTMVDCRQSFSINYGSGTAQQLPPIGSVIAHNHVYNTTSSNINVGIYQINVSELDVNWNNNLMNQGIYSGFNYTDDEVITGIDPSMALAGTSIEMLEPGEGSALRNFSVNEYPDVLIDIRGRERDTIKIPGTSQLPGTIGREMPTRETTGASYYIPPDPPTGVYIVPEAKALAAYASNGEIISDVPEPGILFVYDISGRSLHQQKVEEGINVTTFTSKGMFILKYRSTGGEVQTRKIGLN